MGEGGRSSGCVYSRRGMGGALLVGQQGQQASPSSKPTVAGAQRLQQAAPAVAARQPGATSQHPQQPKWARTWMWGRTSSVCATFSRKGISFSSSSSASSSYLGRRNQGSGLELGVGRSAGAGAWGTFDGPPSPPSVAPSSSSSSSGR